MVRTNASEIQSGDKTHNHGHVITPPNLSPMNRIARSPVNPMPPLDVVVLLLIIYFIFF